VFITQGRRLAADVRMAVDRKLCKKSDTACLINESIIVANELKIWTRVLQFIAIYRRIDTDATLQYAVVS